MTWRPYLDLQIIQHSLYERGIPPLRGRAEPRAPRRGRPGGSARAQPRGCRSPSACRPSSPAFPSSRGTRRGPCDAAIEAGPTLYHVFAPFEGTAPRIPWLPAQVGRNEVPLVVSVYDLIPEVMDYLVPGSRDERFYRIRSRMLAHADLLLAISEHTRQDVIDHLGVHEDRVCVVGAGCSDYFRRPLAGESPDAVYASVSLRSTDHSF